MDDRVTLRILKCLFSPTLVRLIVALTGLLQTLCSQELAPRAYVITPMHSNAIIMTYSFYDGSVLLDGAVPIANASGTYSLSVFTYYHAIDILGRSANINASLPYAVGTFQGSLIGEQQQIYRSGLADSEFRISVNLRGAPAMPPQKFVKWKQKTLLGISLKITAPTGQYDSNRLVNWGSNRWALKPEFGYSERWGNWVLDAYSGVWFYSANPRSFSTPLPQRQTESPIGAFESHLSYDLKPRLWVSLDGNFWIGGLTSLGGIANPATRQTSSRIGATASFPLGKYESVKISYSNGDYIRFGGNYQNIAVGWEYSWLGRPR